MRLGTHRNITQVDSRFGTDGTCSPQHGQTNAANGRFKTVSRFRGRCPDARVLQIGVKTCGKRCDSRDQDVTPVSVGVSRRTSSRVRHPFRLVLMVVRRTRMHAVQTRIVIRSAPALRPDCFPRGWLSNRFPTGRARQGNRVVRVAAVVVKSSSTGQARRGNRCGASLIQAACDSVRHAPVASVMPEVYPLQDQIGTDPNQFLA